MKFKVVQKLEKFLKEPQLLGAPYDVKLPVSTATFACFMKALNDDEYHITADNVEELTSLCDFFEFTSLQEEINEFCSSSDFRKHHKEKRIMELESRVHSLEKLVQSLTFEVCKLREERSAENLAAIRAQVREKSSEFSNNSKSLLLLHQGLECLYGYDRPKDIWRAKDLLKESADLGNPYAQWKYAQFGDRDAAGYYKSAADAGHADASFAYALALICGNNVKQDFAEAKRYMQSQELYQFLTDYMGPYVSKVVLFDAMWYEGGVAKAIPSICNEGELVAPGGGGTNDIMRMLYIGGITTDGTKERFRKIMCVMTSKNPFIYQVEKIGVTPQSIGISYSNDRETLKSFLRNKANYSETRFATSISKCIYGIVCGMEWLHKQGIVHYDLNPENIVVMNDEPRITGMEFYWHRIDEKVCRCHFYMDPLEEDPWIVDDDNSEYERIDVYAFGRILYRMFESEETIGKYSSFRSWRVERHLKKIDRIPSPILDIINMCCDEVWNSRPSFAKLRQMLNDDKSWVVKNTKMDDLDRYIKSIESQTH